MQFPKWELDRDDSDDEAIYLSISSRRASCPTSVARLYDESDDRDRSNRGSSISR